jgi:hypothetical protein
VLPWCPPRSRRDTRGATGRDKRHGHAAHGRRTSSSVHCFGRTRAFLSRPDARALRSSRSVFTLRVSPTSRPARSCSPPATRCCSSSTRSSGAGCNRRAHRASDTSLIEAARREVAKMAIFEPTPLVPGVFDIDVHEISHARTSPRTASTLASWFTRRLASLRVTRWSPPAGCRSGSSPRSKRTSRCGGRFGRFEFCRGHAGRHPSFTASSTALNPPGPCSISTRRAQIGCR